MTLPRIALSPLAPRRKAPARIAKWRKVTLVALMEIGPKGNRLQRCTRQNHDHYDVMPSVSRHDLRGCLRVPALRGDFQPHHRCPGRTRHFAGYRGSLRSIEAILMSPVGRNDRDQQRTDGKRLSTYWGRETALHPRLLFRFPNFDREHLTLSLGAATKMRPAKFKFAASGARQRGARMPPDTLCLRKEKAMDTTTLLIIVVIVLLLGGGGFYGRGRWW
jgi:hypothetical protein